MIITMLEIRRDLKRGLNCWHNQYYKEDIHDLNDTITEAKVAGFEVSEDSEGFISFVLVD